MYNKYTREERRVALKIYDMRAAQKRCQKIANNITDKKRLDKLYKIYINYEMKINVLNKSINNKFIKRKP